MSIYQGGAIMLLCVYLREFVFTNIVAITFTSLVLAELINVAFEIHRWHRLMIGAEIVTVIMYVLSLVSLRSTFDISFVLSAPFFWKVAVVTATSCVPIYVAKFVRRRFAPPPYEKIKG